MIVERVMTFVVLMEHIMKKENIQILHYLFFKVNC
jgi:hypothetical protein